LFFGNVAYLGLYREIIAICQEFFWSMFLSKESFNERFNKGVVTNSVTSSTKVVRKESMVVDLKSVEDSERFEKDKKD
jgi:hypothetical protein